MESRECTLSKGGVRDPEVAHPHTKIGEEPGGGGTPIDGSTRTLGRLGCHFGQLQSHKGYGFLSNVPLRVGF